MKQIIGGFLCAGVAFFLLSISASANVRTGMDRVDSPEARALLSGKRWSVLSHPASKNAAGEHLVDHLFRRQKELGITLVSLFGPEHGFRGDQDTSIPDSIDPKTGLPVYSLYGPRRAPTPEHLAVVDGVIIDLQDVGVRYYTFATTMALVMRACKNAGKKVVILDRPNPIGGQVWEGALVDPALQGHFISYYPIPTVHGLTMGELARLFNGAFRIGADLAVLKMEGWRRADLWRDTGLPWIPPSPALLDPEQAELYSFLGTLESVNFAVGRGKTNEQAFRVFGAPWIQESEVDEYVRRLNALRLPGLEFHAVEWKASRAIYEGKNCRGFEAKIVDFRKVEGLKTLLAVLTTTRRFFGKRFDVSSSDRWIGRRWVREAIERGESWESIRERVSRESEAFGKTREAHLIYE